MLQLILPSKCGDQAYPGTKRKLYTDLLYPSFLYIASFCVNVIFILIFSCQRHRSFLPSFSKFFFLSIIHTVYLRLSNMSSFSSSGYISSRSTSRAGSLASCEQSSYQIDTTLRSSSSLLSSREDIRGEPAISFPVSRWSSYYSRPERSPLSTVNARQGNEAISFTGAKRDAATSVETNRASFSLGSSTHPSFSCSTELEPKRARLSTVTASSPADLQADTSIERERIGTSNSRIADVSDTNIPATNIIHRDSTDMAARRTARRRITGTARPGTAIGEHRILAIAEGRGIPAEVGLCVIHVNSGECILSQVKRTFATHSMTFVQLLISAYSSLILHRTTRHCTKYL